MEDDGLSAARPLVDAGKADGYLDVFPSASLAVEENPRLRLAGPQIEAAPYGIVLAKGSDLTKPIQQALYQVIDDGTYDKFFFSSRRRHTRCSRDWSSDVCSSD